MAPSYEVVSQGSSFAYATVSGYTLMYTETGPIPFDTEGIDRLDIGIGEHGNRSAAPQLHLPGEVMRVRHQCGVAT
jgi:hypothetical protein